MNRRTFLKSIATVCGAAVVCPGELLKGEPKPVVGLPTHAAQPHMKWINYCITYSYDPSNLEKFRAAFKIHPFEPPFR